MHFRHSALNVAQCYWLVYPRYAATSLNLTPQSRRHVVGILNVKGTWVAECMNQQNLISRIFANVVFMMCRIYLGQLSEGVRCPAGKAVWGSISVRDECLTFTVYGGDGGSVASGRCCFFCFGHNQSFQTADANYRTERQAPMPPSLSSREIRPPEVIPPSSPKSRTVVGHSELVEQNERRISTSRTDA